jgi:hypothetical protein
MIECTHAAIRKLLDAGFKILFHSYLSLKGVKANITVFRNEPHMTLQGRSTGGDFREALQDLIEQGDPLKLPESVGGETRSP